MEYKDWEKQYKLASDPNCTRKDKSFANDVSVVKYEIKSFLADRSGKPFDWKLNYEPDARAVDYITETLLSLKDYEGNHYVNTRDDLCQMTDLYMKELNKELCERDINDPREFYSFGTVNKSIMENRLYNSLQPQKDYEWGD